MILNYGYLNKSGLTFIENDDIFFSPLSNYLVDRRTLMYKIAIDIGGTMTLSLKERDQGDGTFTYPEPFKDCFEVISRLAAKFGGENLFIISKASGSARIEANHELLRRWEFTRRFNVPTKNIVIYDGREFGRDKKAKYVTQFGITDMIDDSLEVLMEMPDSVRLIAYKPDSLELKRYSHLYMSRPLYIIEGWRELGHFFAV